MSGAGTSPPGAGPAPLAGLRMLEIGIFMQAYSGE